jgi:ATP-dependent DNA helicase RecG
MAKQYQSVLAPYIERARKVLQHEQRTHHQDQAIKPGGLERFISHWADETTNACKQAALDQRPIYRFIEHFEGYHSQDPLQRAASLRSAFVALNELDGQDANTTITPPSAHAPAPDTTTQKSSTNGSGNTLHKAEVVKSSNTKKEPEATQENSASEQAVASSVGPLRPIQPPPPPPANTVQLEAGMSQGHTTLTLLSAEITAVPGVGPSVAARLHHLGIHTIRDMLFYFPREHRDYSKLEKITNIPFNELSTTMGLIWDVETKRTGAGRTRTIATISDETGKLYASWFNQPYLEKKLKTSKGAYLVVTGTKQRFGNKVEFSVRSHEFPEQGDLLNTGRLVPTYPLTEGLNASRLRMFTKWVVDRYAAMVPEYLPASLRAKAKLLPLPEAVAQMHYPESEEMRVRAKQRLAFDELFLIQLGMQERRSRWQQAAPEGNIFKIDATRIFIDSSQLSANEQEKQEKQELPDTSDRASSTLWAAVVTDQPFEATLPFSFTGAQRRVICEIFADLAQSKPMCRLLQGDVGAGKTAVAAAALLMAALNGYQGAIMAPTELLAEQHARSIGTMLEPFGIRTVLLTGSQRTRERAQSRQALESGEAAVAIGTHALIQDDVNFQKLGLVVVDEQHRFGVEQRDALRQKGYHPHMLVMTATPIPRTLSLTLYGDLDLSVLDQLPPGRQKIITRWRTGARRGEANTLIAHQIAEGRQAFIICPLIEESETIAAKAATSEYERLQREVFPRLRLGLLHGGMKATEKDAIMRRFRDAELDILVATSVIEVGIDVPNATVMVIEDADRFGLSQLHQFRGRVGRGKYQSYCYVLSADASVHAQERLGVFQETDDGFRLAEADLQLRGPGDFIGVRQSGMPELHMADLSDTPMIELTRNLAADLWGSDPYLRKAEHSPLRERMHRFWQRFMAH